MTKLFDLGKSETEEEPFDSCHKCAYDQVPLQFRWTAFWLGVVFLLCLIASCQEKASNMGLGVSRAVLAQKSPTKPLVGLTNGAVEAPNRAERH